MKQEEKQANNDNRSNQLNKNNAEYGNSRNNQNKQDIESQKEIIVPKENKGDGNEKLKP